jgi:hypothetical protein
MGTSSSIQVDDPILIVSIVLSCLLLICLIPISRQVYLECCLHRTGGNHATSNFDQQQARHEADFVLTQQPALTAISTIFTPNPTDSYPILPSQALAPGLCARLNTGLCPPARVIPFNELRRQSQPCAAGSFKTVWRGTWARPGEGGEVDVALLHARAGDLAVLRQELRVCVRLADHPGRALAISLAREHYAAGPRWCRRACPRNCACGGRTIDLARRANPPHAQAQAHGRVLAQEY